jgi:hypothetical protein
MGYLILEFNLPAQLLTWATWRARLAKDAATDQKIHGVSCALPKSATPWGAKGSSMVEPGRPKMEEAVLALLMSEALHPADFTIREDGVVRLNPELARRVVQTLSPVTAHRSSGFGGCGPST